MAEWPPGPVDHARFGGILEGRHDDPAPLEGAVARLNEMGLVEAELEIEGGRYSLMLDGGRIPGRRMSDSALAELVDCLGDLVEGSGHPETAECTLHCSVLARGAVRETLFVPRDGRVHAMSRVRAVAEGCAEPDPEVTTAALRRFGRRQAIWIAAVLLAAFGLAAWQSGYIDRILSRDPERIKVDTGPFGEDLAVVLDNTWGNYEVTLRRGPSYPTTEEAITKRREAAADLPHRAALGILSEGGTIYVQLRDGSPSCPRPGGASP
jgi:hypothetical protein